jgi:serine/threonine protein phosphatase PrpC
MGTYLSTPVTEKGREEGEESLVTSYDIGTDETTNTTTTTKLFPTHCAWGVTDMQGWRKTMEDAHVAKSIPLSSSSVSEALLRNPKEDEDPHPENPVLEEDRLSPVVLTAQQQYYNRGMVFGVFDGHGGAEVARFCGLYLVSVFQQQYQTTSNTGDALRATFHALDRMIDDPNRRDELIRLRAIAPIPGEQREARTIPPVPEQSTPPVSTTITHENPLQPPVDTKKLSENDTTENAGEDKTSDAFEDTTAKQEEVPTGQETTVAADGTQQQTEANEQTDGDDESDADSQEAVGKEDAAENDQDLSSDEEDDNENNHSKHGNPDQPPEESKQAVDQVTAEKVTSMFQRLLNLKAGTSGELVVQVGGQNGEEVRAAPLTTTAKLMGQNATGSIQKFNASVSTLPTIVRNGQLMCNLPDHPIHAGATAIVAVLTGRTLTVANAGDSRAVLCRAGGRVLPLSEDHKPNSPTELARIRKAGGFVNAFGRVNGNLNLSRSIGDLKYKQVPGLSPAEQMITAEPDITE